MYSYCHSHSYSYSYSFLNVSPMSLMMMMMMMMEMMEMVETKDETRGSDRASAVDGYTMTTISTTSHRRWRLAGKASAAAS